jgi:hypothetical protein
MREKLQVPGSKKQAKRPFTKRDFEMVAKAATAPQSEGAPPFPKMPVYVVGAEKSRQLGA